jgi:hypothetical protein
MHSTTPDPHLRRDKFAKSHWGTWSFCKYCWFPNKMSRWILFAFHILCRYESLDRESNPRPLAYGNTASIKGTTTLTTKPNPLLQKWKVQWPGSYVVPLNTLPLFLTYHSRNPLRNLNWPMSPLMMAQRRFHNIVTVRAALLCYLRSRLIWTSNGRHLGQVNTVSSCSR